GDGLDDGEELAEGTDPLDPDTDADGLNDGDEIDLGTDPNDPDSDGDQLTDGAEVAAGLDPTDPADAIADADGDGLDNRTELTLGTNPFDDDSDGDGLLDGVEVNELGTNPAVADTDGGGRPDGIEVNVDGTDPLDPADDVPAVNLPTDLFDGAGFKWDITRAGAIGDGGDGAYDDAFDTGLSLTVGPTAFPSQNEGRLELGRRQVVIGPADIAGLRVTRRIYVPADGQFARYIETLENLGADPIQVDVRINGNMGSDAATVVVGDSSGDGVVGVDDDWFITDDGVDGPPTPNSFAAPDPDVGFVFSDGVAPVQPSAVTRNSDSFAFTFPVQVPPGGRALVVHFCGQYVDHPSALAGIGAIAGLGDAYIAGMAPNDLAAVVNLQLSPDGDGDGLSDLAEVALGTDPNNPDTDNDGLPDGYEVNQGLNPLDGADALLDADGDGLNAREEFEAGTAPDVADTDRDGLLDGDEIDLGTDPLAADTDGGGRLDGEEVDQDGTDPLVPEDDLPTASLPIDLTDGADFLWDVQPDGTIADGTDDAYDEGSFQLIVGATAFPEIAGRQLLGQGGREVVLGPRVLEGLDVTRRVFVPADAQFARFVEVLENNTGGAVELDVTVRGDLGSDLGTQVVSESNGDGMITFADDWFITDDGPEGDPTIAWIVAGPGGVRPTDVSLADDLFRARYHINLPAGGRALLLHFAAQHADQVRAAANVMSLVGLEGPVLSGLSPDDLADVSNFVLAR
ncbi:MAG: hypothetical protein KC620_15755, partial [Myxococcales bacterium]|nr:hypothetical protein [Myxococcales bacterium]